jgi:hypothetical protein
LYNLTENIRLRTLKAALATPILKLAVFVDADSLRSVDPVVKVKAEYMAYKLKKEGHDIGVLMKVDNALTPANFFGKSLIFSNLIQNACGSRPITMRFASPAFDLSLCSSATGAGVRLLEGNLQSAWLDEDNHFRESELLRNYSTSASLISSQMIEYLPVIPRSPVSNDIIDKWLNHLNAIKFTPVSLENCTSNSPYSSRT